MKVYVSADIEGICGIAHWDEARAERPEYQEHRERMTDHVAAACEGALSGGATDVLVKDAHASGRNLLFDRLPREVRLVRGWSMHPMMMVQELDESFDALLMVGYHAGAGSSGNPLAHTLSSSKITWVRLGGREVSEFHLYGYAAASLGVPVAMVSGDEALCTTVRNENEHIVTVPVLQGIGASTVSIHPSEARARIRQGAKKALSGELASRLLVVPTRLDCQVRFREASLAYRMSYYPGARGLDAHTVGFATDRYFEVLRFLTFAIA